MLTATVSGTGGAVIISGASHLFFLPQAIIYFLNSSVPLPMPSLFLLIYMVCVCARACLCVLVLLVQFTGKLRRLHHPTLTFSTELP